MNYAILFDKDNKEVPVKNEQEYNEKLRNGHTIAPVESEEDLETLKEEALRLGIEFKDNISLKTLKKKIQDYKKENETSESEEDLESEEK